MNWFKILIIFISFKFGTSDDLFSSLFEDADRKTITDIITTNLPNYDDWCNTNGLSKLINNPDIQKMYEKVKKKILKHNDENFKNNLSQVFLRVTPKNPEIKKTFSGLSPTTKLKGRAKRFIGYMECKMTLKQDYQLPQTFSWRKFKQTKVVDQGDTGSCWAFSMADSLSYFLYKNDNITAQLSTQQACDCSPTANCVDGGFMTDYCDMCMSTGVASDATYPFTGKMSSCKVTTATPRAIQSSYIRSYCFFNTANETQLMYLIHQYGPLPVSIFTSFDVFWYYGGGIITPVDYNNQPGQPDHAVLIVGFGVCPVTRLPYWEMKNSWGTGWGEGGYFRIKRGGNVCSIMDFPESFVIVKK